MDAEIICQMTLGIRDQLRVDEIQRRCCMLLEQGKSWEYISAMVQLMANKESVFMRQGLLDLGADFEADMERAASYVEKNVQKLTEAINVIKSGRRLSGEKKKLAERLGQFTTSSEASEALYADLVDMRERFRNIGAYPDLVAAASMWDGKTELDPVEMARSYSRSAQEQAAAEANMTREEWEEAQAAKAAKQAAEEGTGSLFGSYSLRTLPDGSRLSPSGRFRVENDSAGLAEHLEDEIAPIKIDVPAGDTRTPKEIMDDAMEFLLTLVGDRPIGKTGYTLRIVKGTMRRKRNTHKIKKPERYAAFSRLEEVIARAYRLSSALPEHREGESDERNDKLEHTGTIERFGYPAIINGGYCVICFTAQSRNVGDTGVLLDEFGVTTRIKPEDFRRSTGSSQVSHDNSSGRVILGDVLMNVKDELKAWPKISEHVNIPREVSQLIYSEQTTSFSLRTAPPPKKTGIGYKVFYQKDGKLYPPMVANPGGQDTPVGVWLDADEGTRAGESKTGRPQVKAGGKGTQGGSGTLAYRPGWHLGEIPYAVQFNRKDPVTGEKSLFPAGFVWAEVEYAMDEDYQEEAMNYGYTENGKFRHSYAGLPRLPKDGFYKYRTNPNPATDPWIITGAMKVNRILSNEEVDELVRAAGREPQRRAGETGSFSTRTMTPEMQSIVDRAKKDGTYLLAPNGKESNLTPEQWAQVRTKAFKAWFGDWENAPENASKVVDENGEPLVVYHGAPLDFGNTFKNVSDKAWRLQFDPNYSEDTYWFADNKFTAQTYQIGLFTTPRSIERKKVSAASRNREPLKKEVVTYTFIRRRMKGGIPDDTTISVDEALTKKGKLKKNCRAELRLKDGRKTPQGYEGLRGMIAQYNNFTEDKTKTPRSLEEAVENWNASLQFDEVEVPTDSKLYACFLNLRNPLRVDAKGEKFSNMGDKARKAKGSGHDGLIVDNVRDPGAYPAQIENGASIAVFSPTQIKSATDNRGTFDPQNPDITFSLRDMTQAARVMLRRREDDLEGEELIARWDELLARLETASVDRHDGAARLGVLVALLESTRSVLPPDFAKLGRLHALMKWAAVYAHLVSTGEVKRDGALKGTIFEQFVAAMQREYEGSLQKGLSEAEAREVLQELGERRLEEALLKVAKECRARLDVFVKARARERIELMAERAYPKKERGKKSPRGKMEAAYYRAMSTMLAWMDATPEEVAARVQELRARLEKLDEDADAEESGATRAELEEELRIVQLYGDWRGMSAGQARMAAEDFVTFVMTQRHAWDAKLEKERRRREWQRLRMRFSKPYNANTRSEQKRKGSNWKVHKFSVKSLLVNTMSYAQLMLAGRKVFGEAFTRSRLQEIADANAALRNARRERDDVFARALMEATGKTGEGELVRWLNRFGKVEKKTGIFKREVTRRTLEMERAEAEEWCAMTPQQRAARRRELNEEAESTGLAPQNVPTEADVEKLREELAAMDERGSKAQKLRVKVPRYGEKIELEASRDAVANAILLLEQEDYQHLIEHEGFTPRDKDGKEINRDLDPDTPLDVEQTLKPLYDFIGSEGRAFVYALRRYVGQNGKRMQEVYEAHQGVPLAMKPNYWRGNFNINTIKEKDTLTDGNGAVGSGGGYGFLIDRVKHYNRLEWTNTATMVFGMTVEAQNNYTYTSGITREWRALLADTDFQKRMEVELGRNYMTALKAWLDVIDKSKGGFAAFADIATWTQRMSRGLAYATLAGNGFVLVKQSSALLHGLMGGEVPRAVVERGDGVRELTWRKIGVAEYAAAMARTKAGQGKVSLKELAACEWFKARTDSDYKNLARRMSLAEDKKQHAYSNKVAEKSMDAINWVDRMVNLLGMQALADAVYRDLERINAEQSLGLTEEQMKGEALAAVGRALTLSAQPNEASEKSLFAAQGGLISNMLFQFKSETVNKLGLLIARMYAGDYAAGIGNYMAFGAMNTLIAAALAWLRYGDEPEEDEEWKYFTKYGLNMLTGDLAAMPLVGEMVQSATSAVTGEYVYQRGFIANYIDPRGILRSAERLATGKKGRKEMDWHGYVAEANALARKLGVLSAFLGDGATWAELVLSAAAASNVIRTGADVVNGVAREE